MGRKSKLQIELESQEDEGVIIPEVIENIPVLVFKCSGWCNELNKSYTQGIYKPVSRLEYELLKKYAK